MHSNEDDSWFITKRYGNAYDEVSVDKKHIYAVKRTYRQNKENPWLSVCTTQIRGLLQKVFQSFYLLIYKVIPHEENKQFSLPRQANAKHPFAPPYFWQDPATVAATDEKLQLEWLNEKVHAKLTKEETETLSETLKNSKIINKRKYKLNNRTIKPPKQENEVECIVKHSKKRRQFCKLFSSRPMWV